MSRLRILSRDGTATVEFALLVPVLIVMLLGLVDLGLAQYMRSVLEGAMQRAGRNSSLESGKAGQEAIDARVLAQIRNIMPGARIAFTRRNYAAFGDIGAPEDFTDANGNGAHDAGECFLDANGNGLWDADMGKAGLGGADDVVVYSASLSYDSLMPLAGFGLSPVRQLSVSTTLRNQPYSTQAERTAVQVCS